MTQAGRLPRRLGVWSAAAVVIGSTIGSGIFRVPNVLAAETGTVGAIALLWTIGAVVSLAGVLTIAELATLLPRPGGLYVYIREAYGPLPAFLFGWTRLLVIQPSLFGGIAMIFAGYTAALVPMSDTGVRVVAGAAIAALAAANYRSLGWGAVLQNASTGAKVLALVGLAGLAFLFGDPSAGALHEAPVLRPSSWTGFGLALVSVMWTYDGWADVTYVAGEVRDPRRALPAALVGGLLAVAAVYLIVNAAYLYVLPLDAMASSTLVASDAATRIVGTTGASVVAALVMLTTFGALNGTMMTGPRVFYAMAEDGLFFRRIAAVHPRFQTPHTAIVMAALLGLGYVSIRTFEQLAEAFVLGIWPFYALAVSAVFVLRSKYPPGEDRCRTLGYPVVPILFLIAAVALLGSALVRQPGPTLVGFGVILSGVPVYYVWQRFPHGAGSGTTPPA